MHRLRTTRPVAAIAVGLVALIVTSACSSTSSGSSDQSGQSGSAAASPAGSSSAQNSAAPGSSGSASSGGLVIDGETIGDATLVAKAKAEGALTIYTAYTADKEQVIVDAFQKATGIKVDVVGLGTAPLVTRLQAETQAKKYTADITKLGNAANIDSLAKAGDLTAYQPPAAFGIPATANNAGGQYWAWTQSTLAPGYNTAQVSAADAPKSWKDLLDPKWKGQIAIPPFSAGGVEISMYQFLRTEVDPEYWTKLAAQDPSIQTVMASVATALTSGSVEVATVQPSVLTQAIKGGAKVAFVAKPPEGLPLAANFVGQVANAPHPNAAQLYLNFLFSKACQTVISQSIGDYGIRGDVPPPVIGGVTLPALNSGYKFFSVTPADAIANTKTWTDEWNSTFHYSS